jgi:hypothetical protein
LRQTGIGTGKLSVRRHGVVEMGSMMLDELALLIKGEGKV